MRSGHCDTPYATGVCTRYGLMRASQRKELTVGKRLVTETMHKDMLEMINEHGMSVRNVAEELGITPETVKRYIDAVPAADRDDKFRLLTEDEIRLLIGDYTQGREIRHLLADYRIGVTQLYSILAEHKVPSRRDQARANQQQAFLDAVTMYESGEPIHAIVNTCKISASTFYRRYYALRGDKAIKRRRGGRP